MLHLHLVLGRIRLKLFNIKSIVFFGYMYALLDLRSITDEDEYVTSGTLDFCFYLRCKKHQSKIQF